MTQEYQLRILPEIAANEQKLKEYLSEEKSGAGGLGGSSHGSRGHVSALHDRVPASRSRRYHGIFMCHCICHTDHDR